jgi:hypothetical protein
MPELNCRSIVLQWPAPKQLGKINGLVIHKRVKEQLRYRELQSSKIAEIAMLVDDGSRMKGIASGWHTYNIQKGGQKTPKDHTKSPC